MPTVDEKKNQKRRQILDAASSLFLDKSFAATAIDDVVKMAGIAKGTFYLYFKDKYDLLDQIVSYKSAEMLNNAIDNLKKSEDADKLTLSEKALYIADLIMDYLEEHKELAALLNKNLVYCFKSITAADNPEYSQLMESIMKAFINEGYSENGAMITAYIITDMVGSVCCDAVLGTGPYSLDEIRPYLKSAVTAVLEAPKND